MRKESPGYMALKQMQAWLSDGTIGIEEIMHVANDALDRIEKGEISGPGDPEGWTDAAYFVERMEAMDVEADRAEAIASGCDGEFWKEKRARQLSGFTEWPKGIEEGVQGQFVKELTAEQLSLVLKSMMNAHKCGGLLSMEGLMDKANEQIEAIQTGKQIANMNTWAAIHDFIERVRIVEDEFINGKPASRH
ncbi:hypothetical protein [Ensifer aridi]|uniref:hypothetical protein n=1 Tax=Ensifer aridi TaxID=1708715 RepID=UPI000A10AFD5|nr:hypothetical protein [Ensifer aridi]